VNWDTSCVDWADRIAQGRPLIPFAPLFPEEAEAALKIFRTLQLVDVHGQPTMDEACGQWVMDFVAAIFGAFDPKTGKQLIRYFFELVAKKNGKSSIAAGIMLTALIRNRRHSGEYYILAPTKEVADNSFFPARDMVRANPRLNAFLHVRDDHRIITHRQTKAFLKVVSSDTETVGGKKTIGLLIDELWMFGKRANAGAMIREAAGGLTSRPEGFVIYLSTQSDSAPTGVFEKELTDFRAIRDGKVVDPQRLPVIYEFPEPMLKSGEYRKPENWHIPNPNFGKSVDLDFLSAQFAKAERDGKAEVVNFEAKHLNVQVGIAYRSDGWAGALVWERGEDPSLTLDEILKRSEIVTVGIDGGGLDDLLGIAIIGREKDTKRWLCWSHALISDIGIERRKANIEEYNRFERDGDLTKFDYVKPATDDESKLATNVQFVVNIVKRIKEAGILAQVGVDAAGIGAIVDALADIGVTQDEKSLDAVRQGIALMGAIKTVEIKLADYTLLHGASDLMKWCAGNLRIVPTPTAMRVGRDEAGFGKVDPIMALFNAAHLMSLNPEARKYQMLFM
jgi:phage terminase large subunit-like protein